MTKCKCYQCYLITLMCNVSLIAFFIYIYIFFTEDCTGQSVTYIYNNYRDKTFKTITKQSV